MGADSIDHELNRSGLPLLIQSVFLQYHRRLDAQGAARRYHRSDSADPDLSRRSWKPRRRDGPGVAIDTGAAHQHPYAIRLQRSPGATWTHPPCCLDRRTPCLLAVIEIWSGPSLVHSTVRSYAGWPTSWRRACRSASRRPASDFVSLRTLRSTSSMNAPAGYRSWSFAPLGSSGGLSAPTHPSPTALSGLGHRASSSSSASRLFGGSCGSGT